MSCLIYVVEGSGVAAMTTVPSVSALRVSVPMRRVIQRLIQPHDVISHTRSEPSSFTLVRTSRALYSVFAAALILVTMNDSEVSLRSGINFPYV